MNAQPELLGLPSDAETIEVIGAGLLDLLDRCDREGKVVALLQVLGTSGYRATVYPKRQRKEQAS